MFCPGSSVCVCELFFNGVLKTVGAFVFQKGKQQHKRV